MDAQFGFEPLLINGGDDVATAQRHFLKLLEHEVALAVVVVEELAVFGQPATGIIFAVVLLTRLKEVVGIVRLQKRLHFSIFLITTKQVVLLIWIVGFPKMNHYVCQGLI